MHHTIESIVDLERHQFDRVDSEGWRELVAPDDQKAASPRRTSSLPNDGRA